MDRRGPGHSAPYGQACLHCFKSKCRCVSRPDGDGCQRCHRLNKQCCPSDSFRKRNTQKNQNSTARIAHLEGRLEGLVSLLQSVAKSPDSSDSLRKVLDENLAGHGQPSAEPQVITPISISSNAAKLPSAAAADSDYTAVGSPLETSYSLEVDDSPNTDFDEPPDDEADAYLAIFRSQMLKHLSFVHIPLELTVQQLRQKRPFLLRAIIAVASSSAQQKMARGKELKRILAQKVIIENQSSLDLLLGVLTYVAWSWDTLLNKSGTLSRLIMLAISIVGNLRLDKPLPEDVHMIGPLTPGFADGHKCEVDDPEQCYLERQRAVLGCFILSSIVSSYYAQMDPMRWTPQMEEGLRAIASNKECPTDEAFAVQIRLQLLAQRTLFIREQQGENHPHVATAPLPTFVYLNSLHGQLNELRESISSELEQEKTLVAQVHYIELCINEATHTANSSAPLLTTPSIGDNDYTSGYERLECLWRSVNAIKSWFDIFFTLSPSAFRGLSFPFWAQLARCTVILYRLSTLEDPAWDRKAVRDVVDLSLVLDQIAKNMEQASREAGEQSNDDVLMQVSRLLGRFRALVGAKMIPAEAGSYATWASRDATTNVDDQDQNYMRQFFEFGDERWWEELWTGFK
ncbi:putative C6 transcription factor [Jackrogersella minutella]|nr:putative C6 transcription factor [Jackrogersella minutella]